MTVTVRFWAGARAAVGSPEESYDEPGDLAALLDAVRARHPDDRVARVLAVCSFLVDDAPVGRRDHAGVAVPDGSTVEVLPPFAGG